MVNDLGGGFEGSIAAAHAVLSHSIDLRGFIASRALEAHGSTAREMKLGANCSVSCVPIIGLPLSERPMKNL
jgi:hypothetical protein